MEEEEGRLGERRGGKISIVAQLEERNMYMMEKKMRTSC